MPVSATTEALVPCSASTCCAAPKLGVLVTAPDKMQDVCIDRRPRVGDKYAGKQYSGNTQFNAFNF